jgi:N-acetylmuramoyl-L-alanine amidase
MNKAIRKTAIIMIMSALTLIFPATCRAKEYTEQELFERVVEAEAGNQGLTGKRLVAAVIYNRVESERFPDSIGEVLRAPHQFSTVWNGAVERVEVSDETRIAVALETTDRTDPEILYFNNGKVSGRYAYTYKGHRFGK